MAAQGGYGLTATIAGTAIVGIREMDFPAFMKFISESTAHDSAGGYYEAVATGKRRLEPISCTLIWDSSEATHATIKTAFAADTTYLFTVADPDGDETISFNAHLERIGRESRQEETYIANVDLHPSGTASIA